MKGVFLSKIKYVILLVPCILYFVVVNKYSANRPYGDDYDAILDFLCKYKQSNGLYNILSLCFSQHNEHRIFASRIVYIIYYSLFNTINFRHISFIGNSQLLIIFLLIAYFIKKLEKQYIFTSWLILSLCLFDLNCYENANFAMAGVANYGVVMLFLLSMFFYSRYFEKQTFVYLLTAVAFQIICIFSNGNGIIAAGILIGFSWLNKNKLSVVIAGITTAIGTALYFTHYTHTHTVGHGASISQIIPFFLHIIGAFFGFKIGILAGIILLISAIYFSPIDTKFQVQKNAIPLVCILLFAFTSCATASVYRASLPIESSYATRYFIYPFIITAIIFSFVLNKKIPKVSSKIIVVSIVIISVSIYTIAIKYGISGFERMNRCAITFDCYKPEHIPHMKAVLKESVRLHIFNDTTFLNKN